MVPVHRSAIVFILMVSLILIIATGCSQPAEDDCSGGREWINGVCACLEGTYDALNDECVDDSYSDYVAGDKPDNSEAEQDVEMIPAMMISAGIDSTCAITDSGEAKCWGSNRLGQLGDGTDEDRYTPVTVSTLDTGVMGVLASGYFGCALDQSGYILCWGANVYNVFRHEYSGVEFKPIRNLDLGTGNQMISNGEKFICALTEDGHVTCWGEQYNGRLGRSSEQLLPPTIVDELGAGNKAVSCGTDHVCFITGSGKAMCRGGNDFGQLGDGQGGIGAKARHIPVDVSGMGSGVAMISASEYFTCAVTVHGAVKCWGSNEFGRLGVEDINGSTVPVDVTGLDSGAVAISTGPNHACVLMESGGVKCWGSGSTGQLGDGKETDSAIPVDVVGLSSGVIAISAGTSFTCARMESGGVKCWGFNRYGQLGNGEGGDIKLRTLVPIDVVGF